MLQKLKSLFPPKWKMAAIISISFSTAFMVFIYSPFDIFLHNPTAFVVSWRFLLPPLLVAFLFLFISMLTLLLFVSRNKTNPVVIMLLSGGLVFVLISIMFQMFAAISIYIITAFVVAALVWILLLSILKEKSFDVFLLTVWGLLISTYVQILFLNGDMTAITGAFPEYRTLTLNRIINALLWVIITALPLCLWGILRKKKKEFRYEKVLVLSVSIFVVMQITGLISTAATVDLPRGYDEYGEEGPQFISYEPALNLSSEQNIMVFIIDKMDVEFLREIFTGYTDFHEKLDGFTFYENSVAEFFDTFPSTVSMLTQHYYREGLTIAEYWAEAWAQYNVIDTIREHGFTTNLYLDYLSTYGTIDDIRSRTDNLRGYGGIRVNTGTFYSTIARLSLGRAAPYLMKNFLLSTITPAFGNSFISYYTHDYRSVHHPVVSSHTDWQFHQYIYHNDLTTDSDKRFFSVMHLNGAHGGVPEGVRGIPRNIPGLVASLDVLCTYFEKMKEIGVYDNTTIFIVGDHGASSESEKDYGSGWNTPVLSGTLIKPAGGSGVLKFDTVTEISNRYLAASILDAANIPYEWLGQSYFDIFDGNVPPYRVVYGLEHWWTAWVDNASSGTLIYRGHYEINGDAAVPANWRFIPS